MAQGHTITITPTQKHLEITIGGEIVASSDRPVLLDETGLPTRYYIPRDDVKADLRGPTGTHTTCPFKGDASYWTVSVGDRAHEDVAWSYETPIPSAEQITGLVCFYNDRVDITLDGSPVG
jgi:uncharacterized protein (DUF427 family)